MDLQYLTEEERANYKAMRAVFESSGWTAIIRNAENQLERVTKELESVNTVGELKYAQGTIDTLRGLTRYPELIDSAYASIIESRREDELEIEESFGANE